MDYLKQYRHFITSHYFSEGTRMTAGILIPALAMDYFNLLQLGIVMSLGALAVSITDNPGPVHHRRNGMMVCTVLIFLMSLLANATNQSVWLTGMILVVASVLFSMLGVFGARPGAIGISAMVVFTLHMDESMQPQLPMINHAALLAAGATWYTLFSLALTSFRPYRLARQAMGDWILSTATYLRTRSRLYNTAIDHDQTLSDLVQLQVTVQQKQTMVRELLLKTRMIVKESTPTGRLLLIIFIDVSDLFEKLITSYTRYSKLREAFGHTGILPKLQLLIQSIASEMEDIAYAIQSGQVTTSILPLEEQLEEIKEHFNNLATEHPGIEPAQFFTLEKIIFNAEDIIRILSDIRQSIRQGIPHKKMKFKQYTRELEKFADKQPMEPRMLLDNLSLKSDVFRHTLRITIALLVGFLLAIFFNIGHGHWILLTILVIMKPAYSLSKNRNRDRLIGTIAGVVIGIIILTITKNTNALLIIMILLMVANFSLMRTQYMLSVMMMTPYILIFFYLLRPGLFDELLKDRLIDTAIGSVIAFVASHALFPSWEKHKLQPLLLKAVEQIKSYFNLTTAPLHEATDKNQQRLSRKEAFIALANVSDAFSRMLNEPKYQQHQREEIQKMVALLHAIVSYIATLNYYIQEKTEEATAPEITAATGCIATILQKTVMLLKNEPVVLDGENKTMERLNEYAAQMVKQQKQTAGLATLQPAVFNQGTIVQQYNLIHRSAKELLKVTATLQFRE